MQLPFILSVPHCGVQVPQALRSSMALDDREILESVDFGTYEIFGHMPAQAVIKAHWSRLVADLNRNPQQRDAKGVVALIDYHGRRVFKPGSEPAAEQIEQRVQRYHRPYHELLQQALGDHSYLALLDCHSLNGRGPADAPDAGQMRKDITLSNNGDLEGKQRTGMGPVTCPPDLLQAITGLFGQQGFSTSVNHPYKGGYIVNNYAPSLLKTGRFAIQIEMNQDLYMEAGSLEPDPGRISEVTERMTRAFFAIADRLRA
jgi:N-formylglutamate deformylase